MITLDTVKAVCLLVATGMFVLIGAVTTVFVTKRADQISSGVEQAILETKGAMSNANKAALELKEGASNFNKITLDLKEVCEKDIIKNIEEISEDIKGVVEDIKDTTNGIKKFTQSVVEDKSHEIIKEVAYSFARGYLRCELPQMKEKPKPEPVPKLAEKKEEEEIFFKP